MILYALLFTVLLAQSRLPSTAENAVIAGTVYAPNGNPAAGKRVAAMSADEAGPATSLISIGQTDKDGRYALEGVPAGRYYIIAGPLDAPAYLPGVWDRKEATIVSVSSGMRREGLDIHLRVLPVEVKVQGHLMREGAENVGVAQVEVRLSGRPGTPYTYTTVTKSDGSFLFPEVRLGVYQAYATTSPPGRAVEFVAGPTGVNNMTLLSAPGARVSGRLIREAPAATNPGKRQLRLVGPKGTFTADVAPDGSFDFAYLPADRYRVEADQAPIMRPLSVTIGTVDVTDLAFMIPPGFRVAGKVLREDFPSGQPVGGQVLLTELVRAAATIFTDGSFEFPAVAPGTYAVEITPKPQARWWPELKIVVTDKDVPDIRWIVPSFKSIDPRALLESDDQLDQAWGAWVATNNDRHDLAPLIQKKLEARLATSGATLPYEVANDTALDALIRFDAKLPLATLEALFPRRPAQTLIFVSRLDSNADSFLMPLINSQHEQSWFAAANLLLAHRARGFTAALMKGLQLEAHLVVCDPGETCAPRRMASNGGIDSGTSSLAGFPPWPGYTLTRKQGELLVSGPVPVYAERRVMPAGQRPPADGAFISTQRPTGNDRLMYVRATNPEIGIAIQDYEERSTKWRGQEALQKEVESFKEDIRSRYAQLIRDLLAAGALSPEEEAAVAKPNLKFVIDDLRAVNAP
jgi:hypothetical protein